jgi:hypothetical protein
MSMSIAAPHYLTAPTPVEVSSQPSLGGVIGAGLGQGLASSIQQQIKRSVLDKVLSQVNPNMSVIDKMKMISQVDPEYQQGLMQMMQQEGQAQAEAQRAQAYTGVLNQMTQPRGIATEAGAPSTGGMAGEAGAAQPAFTPEQLQGLKLSDVGQLVKIGQTQQGLNIREKGLQQREKLAKQTSEEKISLPILESLEKNRSSIHIKKNAISQMKQSVVEGNLSGLTKDYLADITGAEPLRSASGSLFKTASKEFFLGNIARTGSRPNQWVEQQIADMMPKIGRSREANLSVAEALDFETDLSAKEIEITDKLADESRRKLGYVPANIGRQKDELMKPYVEERQKVLAYRLRKIKEQENPSVLNSMKRVPHGTPLTLEKARVLLKKTNGDEKAAQHLANQLGYEIPDETIYEGE